MPPPDPYVVYGTITKNGVVQNNVTVTIANLTRGGNDTRTTDADGNYIYDLAQLPNGYVSGDSIRVSIPDGTQVTFIAGNPEEREVSFNYTVTTITASAGALIGGVAGYSTIGFNSYSWLAMGGGVAGGVAGILVLGGSPLYEHAIAIYRLENRLTSPYAKGAGTNNRKLLKIASDECDEISTVISNIQNAHFINQVVGKQLENLGSLLQTIRATNEIDTKYRARIKIAWWRYTRSATIQDLKTIIAALLNTNTNRISIIEDFQELYAYFKVRIWQQDMVAAGLTDSDLYDLIHGIKGAGISVTVIQNGTFECRNASDINDPNKGYYTYDVAAPGGTYSGLL